MSEQASERLSAVERASEASSAEQANDWAARANERVAWVVKKHNFLKKANLSRLKWIKPAKILCFFKRRIFFKNVPSNHHFLL